MLAGRAPAPASSLGSVADGLDTPALLVDLDILEKNIREMAAHSWTSGVTLRPHAKTHKSLAVAAMQIAAGARGLACATLGEAEVFVEASEDLFVAYPLVARGPKARRLQALHERAALRVGVDSPTAIEALGRAVKGSGKDLGVLVEVDCGGGRSGVAPAEAGRVATAAARAGLLVLGAFTHASHAYRAPELVAASSGQEVEALEQAAESLIAAGHDVSVLSGGSTPTARPSARPPVTEIRPGTYVFGDRQQVALGGCAPDGVALVVAATVVSVAVAGQYVIDAGSKILALDRPEWLAGHGSIVGRDEEEVARLWEHHGVVPAAGELPRPAVGDLVAVIPNHVCPVVNLASELVVTRKGRGVRRWAIDAALRSA
jgi:D-serine deaminase-like pyridoxal phosphate-dependent protein